MTTTSRATVKRKVWVHISSSPSSSSMMATDRTVHHLSCVQELGTLWHCINYWFSFSFFSAQCRTEQKCAAWWKGGFQLLLGRKTSFILHLYVFVTYSILQEQRPPAATEPSHSAEGCEPWTPRVPVCSSFLCPSPPSAVQCLSSVASGCLHSRYCGKKKVNELACKLWNPEKTKYMHSRVLEEPF